MLCMPTSLYLILLLKKYLLLLKCFKLYLVCKPPFCLPYPHPLHVRGVGRLDAKAHFTNTMCFYTHCIGEISLSKVLSFLIAGEILLQKHYTVE